MSSTDNLAARRSTNVPSRGEAPLPMNVLEQWQSDDPCVDEDARPWGRVTESANSFWTPEDGTIELVNSDLREEIVRLHSRVPLLDGLPVERTEAGPVFTRTANASML